MARSRRASYRPDPALILFAKALRRERQNAKLSQRQLGELAGVSQGTVSDIENGAREPGLGLVIRLARALQLHPADLLRDLR